jgi:DNA-3-methyladenine glycosylase
MPLKNQLLFYGLPVYSERITLMARVLNQSFFKRPTLDVARDFLGKQLCRRLASGEIIRGRINETEAYDGFEDKASHAHRGATTRNVVMFGPPAGTYVYLCYGVHWVLNIKTREKGYPAAVLIRGIEGVAGPGRLTKHFQVNSSSNDKLLTRVGGLWLEDDGHPVEAAAVSALPRVGVDYAGDEWAAKRWRFVWKPRLEV